MPTFSLATSASETWVQTSITERSAMRKMVGACCTELMVWPRRAASETTVPSIGAVIVA